MACLKECVLSGQEDLASAFRVAGVETATLPEQDTLLFLFLLFFSKRTAEAHFQQFPAKQGFLSPNQLGLFLTSPKKVLPSPHDLIEALLAEGLGDLLSEELSIGDIDTFPLLSILNYGGNWTGYNRYER